MSIENQNETSRRRLIEPESLRNLTKHLRKGQYYKEILSSESYCMRIAGYTRSQIDNYVTQGVPLGEFLFNVMSNNLIGALGSADDENKRTLWELHIYVYNYTPPFCWGSVGKVEAWLAAHVFCAKKEVENV